MILEGLPDLSFCLHTVCVYLLKLNVKMTQNSGRTNSNENLVIGEVDMDRQHKRGSVATDKYSGHPLDATEYLNTVRSIDYGKSEY